MKEKDIVKYFEVEFFDIVKPLVIGAAKGYDLDNWKRPDGNSSSHKDNYASIMRHVAEAYMGVKLCNKGTVDPRLCAACRLMMDYYRDKNGIIHPDDNKGD